MNEFVLKQADVRVLLWHMALYGLGAILEDAGVDDVQMSWTGGMQPRGKIVAADLTADRVDGMLRAHARQHSGETSWLARDVELSGTLRGVMSPRLTPFGESAVWRRVQQERHEVLDGLTNSERWLDLRQIASLGEPSYWSRNRQDVVMQDDGASRFEMQPRNQGSEIVGSRLRKLAQTVGQREQGLASAGLAGDSTIDEAGNGRADSRTPTGFASPGPTDNAVAWCALWGISQLPVVPRVNATAATAGHVGRVGNEWFFLPVWHDYWRAARLRTILVAAQLKLVAAMGLAAPWGTDLAGGFAGRDWLASRGVVGVVRFPIARFGSDSAPERRAMQGAAIATEST